MYVFLNPGSSSHNRYLALRMLYTLLSSQISIIIWEIIVLHSHDIKECGHIFERICNKAFLSTFCITPTYFYFLFQFKYFHDLKNNFVASNFPLIEVIFSINTFNPTSRLQKLLQASINANIGS